ncbi:uncharacterized protein LOC111899269 [Lactuca sativa]|uniref:uncharacterized protein LOC111899269 n=1 Tax=Lactuca sativa TaxID=4236 RepID=UPI000CD9D807|nr:uncharacterized protein LOC111899269 [Lactuca sativa]
MDMHDQRDPQSRADIIARVFKLKVQSFINYLKQDKPFGEIDAYLYTIEFQKRGLPHCHTLIWVNAKYNIKTPEEVDAFITAELPDPLLEPQLHATITTCMIHVPCGLLNERAPCMKDGKCSKHFPKPFLAATVFDTEGYTRYKHGPDAQHTTSCGTIIHNGYVVPYNKKLCSRFEAHINVEYCGWNMMIKYLFKYISKGIDRVRYVIQKDVGVNDVGPSNTINEQPDVMCQEKQRIDEIKTYLDGRYICPHEAAWRIFDFPIHHRNPAVQILSVHEENSQSILFKEDTTIIQVLCNPSATRTTLLAWFESNAKDPTGHQHTYIEYPKYYKWDGPSKSWDRRAAVSSNMVGRLVFVHPSSGELFYLRLLLCHQKGCTSFEDLRTVSGYVHPTYRSACNALGIIGDDIELLVAFNDASTWATPFQLRLFFCSLLLFSEVTDPNLLWQKVYEKMSDDYIYRLNSTLPDKAFYATDDVVRQQLLHDLKDMLSSSVPTRSLAYFNLPMPSPVMHIILQNRLLLEEMTYDKRVLADQHAQLLPQLNTQQMAIYRNVVSCIEANKQILMFVYGHGGTGKAFLWTTILSFFRSLGKVVLAVAASGIASLLLPSGTTAHSRFKIPIDLASNRSCDIKKKDINSESYETYITHHMG